MEKKDFKTKKIDININIPLKETKLRENNTNKKENTDQIEPKLPNKEKETTDKCEIKVKLPNSKKETTDKCKVELYKNETLNTTNKCEVELHKNETLDANDKLDLHKNEILDITNAIKINIQKNDNQNFELEKEFNRYEIIKALGKGGMGSVILVHDKILKRKVAMKIINPEHFENKKLRTRFVEEARITGNLEHPNIIPVYDLNLSQEALFTMKVVKGNTLSELIKKIAGKKNNKYTLIQLLQIMQNICHAIEFAHSKNIIHRDIKPDNIMIGEFGEVLVLDWGLAKKIGIKEDLNVDNSIKTNSGTLIGTPRYMAPEQAKGFNELIDEKTDLYSLGVMLYEIITHVPPFTADSLMELLNKISTQEPKNKKFNSLKEPIPKEIMAITLKAMSKDKEKRYETVKDFREDIQCFIEGKSVKALPDNVLGKSIKFIKRHIYVSLAIFLAIFILSIVYHLFEVRISAEKIQNRVIYDYWLVNAKKHEAIHKETFQKMEFILNELTFNQESIDESIKILKALDNKLEENFKSAEYYYNSILRLEDNLDIRKFLANLYLEKFKTLLKTKKENYLELADKLIKDSIKIYPEISNNYKKIINNFNKKANLNLIINKNLQAKLYFCDNDYNLNFIKEISNKEIKLAKGNYALKIDSYVFPFLVKTSEDLNLKISMPQKNFKDMIFIHGGEFLTGKLVYGKIFKTAKTFSFFIDKTEVTFEKYINFHKEIKEEKHIPKIKIEGKYENLWDKNYNLKFGFTKKHPVFGINYYSAKLYCKWRTEKEGNIFELPFSGEWEKAARGVDGRKFPFGDKYKKEYACIKDNIFEKEIMPVGSYLKDKSIYGVMDMAGNVSEWTNSKASDNKIIVKGGNAKSSFKYAYSYEKIEVEADSIGYIGLRCILRNPK